MFFNCTENEFRAKQKLLNPNLVSIQYDGIPVLRISQNQSKQFQFLNNLPLNQKILKKKSKLSRAANKELGEPKQSSLLNKTHTHTSQMSFTGTATIYLPDGGLNGMAWLFAALWQLWIVTVDLSIGWMSARTCFSSFAITFP